LFLATIVISFLIMMGESDTSQYINFSSVTGFFQQDDSATDPSSFDYVNVFITYNVAFTYIISDHDKLRFDRPKV
jgi:hypothetical protein